MTETTSQFRSSTRRMPYFIRTWPGIKPAPAPPSILNGFLWGTQTYQGKIGKTGFHI